jgi:hypothetical protein
LRDGVFARKEVVANDAPRDEDAIIGSRVHHFVRVEIVPLGLTPGGGFIAQEIVVGID